MPHSATSNLYLHCLPITLLGVSRLQWGIKKTSTFIYRLFEGVLPQMRRHKPLSSSKYIYKKYDCLSRGGIALFVSQKHSWLGGSVGCTSTWRSEVCATCSTLAGSATFFHEVWSWNIFYGHSLPLTQEGLLCVSGERMCTLLVNPFEDYACSVKEWLNKMTTLDMTPLCWQDGKTSTPSKLQEHNIQI